MLASLNAIFRPPSEKHSTDSLLQSGSSRGADIRFSAAVSAETRNHPDIVLVDLDTDDEYIDVPASTAAHSSAEEPAPGIKRRRGKKGGARHRAIPDNLPSERENMLMEDVEQREVQRRLRNEREDMIMEDFAARLLPKTVLSAAVCAESRNHAGELLASTAALVSAAEPARRTRGKKGGARHRARPDIQSSAAVRAETDNRRYDWHR